MKHTTQIILQALVAFAGLALAEQTNFVTGTLPPTYTADGSALTVTLANPGELVGATGGLVVVWETSTNGTDWTGLATNVSSATETQSLHATFTDPTPVSYRASITATVEPPPVIPAPIVTAVQTQQYNVTQTWQSVPDATAYFIGINQTYWNKILPFAGDVQSNRLDRVPVGSNLTWVVAETPAGLSPTGFAAYVIAPPTCPPCPVVTNCLPCPPPIITTNPLPIVTRQQLDTIPGVGATLAQRIYEWGKARKVWQ